MKVKKIFNILNEMFPLKLQESYDNAGSQIAFLETDITSILFSLDIDKTIIREAIEKNCNLIITHHPFFFKTLKSINTGDPKSDMIIELIKNKISVYSIHTNLDKIYHNKLGEVLGFSKYSLLFETDTVDDNNVIGFGIIAELDSSINLKSIIEIIKEKLNLNYLIYSGNIQLNIKTIAILNGSGGNSIEKIISNKKIDCILTGDVNYHAMKFAIDNSVAIIDAGHYGTEKILINFLLKQVQDYLTNTNTINEIKLYITESEKNPFEVYI